MIIHLADPDEDGLALCGRATDETDGADETGAGVAMTCAECAHEQRRQRITLGLGLGLIGFIMLLLLGGGGCSE